VGYGGLFLGYVGLFLGYGGLFSRMYRVSFDAWTFFWQIHREVVANTKTALYRALLQRYTAFLAG